MLNKSYKLENNKSGYQKLLKKIKDYQTAIHPKQTIVGVETTGNYMTALANFLEERGIGVRVVSMPSWEIFDKQQEDYKKRVIPEDVRLKVAIEAGVSMGWQKYVGCNGEIIGIDRFGKSAPYKVLFEKFGFTADAVAKKVEEILKR